MTQKDCVYERVCEIARQYNIPIDTELGEKIRKDSVLKTNIRVLVQLDFEKDRVKMKDEFRAKWVSDSAVLSRYVQGLVMNWLRKDRRISPPYVPANAGRPLSKDRGDIIYSPTAQEHSLTEFRRKNAEEYGMTDAKKCECGAIHTSNVSHHSSWCPLS